MGLEKRKISILNNFISGIGITSLGFIVTIGSINLYTTVVNLLVYIFIIAGLSSLVNFLLNRKIVRNRQTLLLIFANIILGIAMLIFPKLPLSLVPIIFSIYLLFNSLVKFINYVIFRDINSKSRFKELFFSIFFMIFAFIFLYYPLERLNLFIMIIGIFCIVLGLSRLYEFFIDILFKENKLKVKKRSKITLPAFLEAFIPKRALKKINKYISYRSNFIENINEDVDLKVFIHLSTYGFNQFGHIDMMLDNKIYSYGNYDRNSRKVFNGVGDGVLFITDKKDKYIEFCLLNNRETIVEYGIKITQKQKEKVNNKLQSIMNNVYEWEPPIKTQKRLKKMYYSDKLYKAIKNKFYKFKDGEFKTFFIAGANCTHFINILLKSTVFQSLKFIGILSPGTYYEYLEENYKNKNGIVLYKKIYNKDNLGDIDVKN